MTFRVVKLRKIVVGVPSLPPPRHAGLGGLAATLQNEAAWRVIERLLSAMSEVCRRVPWVASVTREFVRKEWQLTTRDRRKHEVALCWIHDRCELHLLSKENVLQEFSGFREQVRNGRVICHEGNLQDRKDKDGRLWHFLVVQDKPHLAAMIQHHQHQHSDIQMTEVFVAAPWTDPVALMEFDFCVCGFVYFFKKKKNRDALFKFLNDVPTGT
jgi:hypothetical protein